MPSFEQVQQYLTGAARLMLGKSDGLRMLDFSADGFWNSFFAMVVALPALMIGWVGLANELEQMPGAIGGRFSILLRIALIDFCLLSSSPGLRLRTVSLASSSPATGDRQS